MGTRLFWRYCGLQTVLMVALFALPASGWRSLLQVAVGWMAGGCVFAAGLVERLAGRTIWFLFATGTFVNATGRLVELLLADANGNVPPNPNASDAFYFAYFPCVIAALGILVYRRSRQEEADGLGIILGTGLSTSITAALGVIAWELVLSPQADAADLPLLTRIAVTAYPLGDLVVLALASRLLLSGQLRNRALRLILASIFCYLSADITWAVIHRGHLSLTDSTVRILDGAYLLGYALSGAALLHPDIRQLSLTLPGAVPRRGLVWMSLFVSLLTAPMVLVIEALFERVYGPTIR